MVPPPHLNGPISTFRAMQALPSNIDVASLLKSCALALHGEFGATTRFLDHYCEQLRLRIKYDESLRSLHEDEARDDWSIFQEYVDEDLVLTTRLTVPAFDAIWVEVCTLLRNINGGNPFANEYISYIHEEEIYHHITLQKFEVLVFEELRSDVKLADWIGTILSSQPRHFDTRLLANNKPGAKEIPSLTEAFQLHCFGESQIPAYISYMGSLVVSVKRWLLSLREITPDDSDLEDFIASVVTAHQTLVSYPFSHHPIGVRRRLAQINVRNATGILLANVIDLIRFDPSGSRRQDLDWQVFKPFSLALMEKATFQGPQIASEVRGVMMSLGLGDFLDPTVQPLVDWVNDVFEDDLFPVPTPDDEDDPSEFDLEDLLPDVCFEPVGPELRIENYALALTRVSDVAETNCAICIDVMDVRQKQRDEIPLKIECGHTFHYGCLSTLINGISKFSNLCPNCRYQICARREKRLKSDDDLDNALEEVASTAETEGAEVALQRDLQDVEGDVVMTDF